MEVKKPRTCRRQQFRQNAVITEHSSIKGGIKECFRINVTVAFLEVLQNMKSRFEEGQTVIAKGFKLIPSFAVNLTTKLKIHCNRFWTCMLMTCRLDIQ